MTAMPDLSAAALTQRRLWSSDPHAWARYAEPHNRPLFDAVLDAAEHIIGGLDGRRMLDVGCGTGMVLRLAQERGAQASGIDVVDGMLALAADAAPEAALTCGDLQVLPFGDAQFHAVTGVNALQFAADPVAAVAEAARVLVPGGVLVASFFDAPHLSQTTVVHEAMSVLSPPARDAEHAPYALAAPGNYEAALAAAGLQARDEGQVACRWAYPSVEVAVHTLLASAGGTRAVEDVGAERAGVVVRDALRPFVAADGAVAMRAVFRWVSAQRPE